MPFVAFDLYDTLYTFDRVIVRLQEVFGNDMKSLQDPSECKKLFRYWYQWALHDYVACSHAGTYTPLLTVLKETLARALKCYFADEYDQDALVADSSQIQTVMKSFDELELDPKAIEAFQLIHEQQQKSDVKWDIWVLSSIGYNDTAKLISRQDLLNSYIADSNIHCCDDLKVSKPHPKVYSELMRQAVHNTKRIENFYMIGSSASDLAGAKNVSIRTIFLDSKEKVFPNNIYEISKPDRTGKDLADCVGKMLEMEKSQKFIT